jgi:uncharacterized membrane protein YphA (DoxX/SURF4 family)
MLDGELSALVIRFILAYVVLVAGLTKLRTRRSLGDLVADFKVVPPGASRLIASSLVPAELTLGFLLAIGVATRWVAASLAGLLGVFTVGVALNLIRGRRIPCGCFGSDTQRISWRTAGRNIVLVGLAVAVAFNPPDSLSIWSESPRSALLATDAIAAPLISALLLVAVVLCIELSRYLQGGRKAVNLDQREES